MKRENEVKIKTLSVVSVFLLFFTDLIISPALAEKREVLPSVVSINMPHVLPPNAGGAGRNNGPAFSNNLTYHNGPVMSSNVQITPIYWGSSWNDAGFRSDKISGLNALYVGYSNSKYANITSQYSDAKKSFVTSNVSIMTELKDFSIASSKSTDVFNKVVQLIGSNLSPNGYYPVYTDLPRGNAGFCAWHSYGTVNKGGVTFNVKFAFFFSLENDSSCSVYTSLNGYTGVTQSLANVSAHELAEAMSDPELNAWYDKQGYENADKCAWNFSGVQRLGTIDWKLQGEWSNEKISCVWAR